MTDPKPARTRAERLKAIMALYGVAEEEAAFIMAIEEGEIDGDTVELDEAGKEVRRRPQIFKPEKK